VGLLTSLCEFFRADAFRANFDGTHLFIKIVYNYSVGQESIGLGSDYSSR